MVDFLDLDKVSQTYESLSRTMYLEQENAMIFIYIS